MQVNIKKVNSYFSKLLKDPDAKMFKMTEGEHLTWVASGCVIVRMPTDSITFNLNRCQKHGKLDYYLNPEGVDLKNSGLRYDLKSRQGKPTEAALLYTECYFTAVDTELLSLFGDDVQLKSKNAISPIYVMQGDKQIGVILPISFDTKAIFEPMLETIRKELDVK